MTAAVFDDPTLSRFRSTQWLARRIIIASSSVLFAFSLIAGLLVVCSGEGGGFYVNAGSIRPGRIASWVFGISASGVVGFDLQTVAKWRPDATNVVEWKTRKHVHFVSGRDVAELDVWERDPDRNSTQIGNFRWGIIRASGDEDEGVIWGAVPLWFVSALLGIYPAIGVIEYVTRRKVAGRCTVCGYDLRATPTRCPECGAAN